ncbi:hypothetical protein LTR37_003907 [Vermiconidia calcicola]|uniref:Uncharacterized protein n=1 Tax=Vermiconidia calcicola TaxID=1690605 RepID=A0ACC3NNE9_9PEZI|nr:hypothetical protein LTR37_003907 [Vermiconidia calcicola]
MRMTAGDYTSRPKAPSPHNQPSREFFKHSSAQRVNTNTVIVEALRAEYPQLHLSVLPVYGNDLLGFAAAGHAGVAPIDNEKDRLTWRTYIPPARRLDGGRGIIASDVKFGKFLLDWHGKEYILYVVDGDVQSCIYGEYSLQYVLSPSVEATEQLFLEAGVWSNELHNEVWVFDGGYWQKSYELWEAVQKASWDDVILDKSMKDSIINDVDTFFDSRDVYEKLKVPWKRGIIYYGPPGNGKTISIKAMMNVLYKRKDAIPTLYVKSLTSWAGPEYSINEIFTLARRTAPCYLVFEDLDSLVIDEVRSYFLNAVDGIQKNDGILMVGSTNHLDRLDPGIAKRPSRFDRKYNFPNPSEKEREMYMKYWQGKLDDNKDIEFPDKLCPAVAKITNGFSFAYLQEAMVGSLLALAREKDGFAERLCLECMEAHEKAGSGSCDREGKRVFKGLYDWVWAVRRVDEDDPDLDNNVLWREIKKQVRILREELGKVEGQNKA